MHAAAPLGGASCYAASAGHPVLCRCGYVKEAHYRQGWPDQDGVVHDGIGHALLRQDRERGTTTPVDWDGD